MSWQDVNSELKGGLFGGMIIGIFIGGFLYMWLIEEPANARVEKLVNECAAARSEGNNSLDHCLHNALSSR